MDVAGAFVAISSSVRRFALLLLALVACRDNAPACPEGAACATACASDAECGADEICNQAMRCQRRPRCRSNADCEAAEQCDPTSGSCVAPQVCFADLHCAFGELCEDGACVPGCRSDGDCPLYSVCDAGACTNECGSNAFCDLGSVCAAGTCYPSPNPSHCAPCDADRPCPYASDYCLLNHNYDANEPSRGTARYCAVDCLGDANVCPNGYACQPVTLLTEDPCERDIQCQREDRRCLIEEGATRGFCSCGNDFDCLPESLPPRCRLGFCESPSGQLCGSDRDCRPLVLCDRHGGSPVDICANDGSRCDSAEDCLCHEGRCLNTGRVCEQGSDCILPCVDGVCFVGAACAPVEGLYCPELREM